MSRDSSDALEDLRYRREKAHMGGGIKDRRAFVHLAEELLEIGFAIS